VTHRNGKSPNLFSTPTWPPGVQDAAPPPMGLRRPLQDRGRSDPGEQGMKTRAS